MSNKMIQSETAGSGLPSQRVRKPLHLTEPRQVKQAIEETSEDTLEGAASDEDQNTQTPDPDDNTDWKKRADDRQTYINKLKEDLKAKDDALAKKAKELEDAQKIKKVLPLTEEEEDELGQSFPQWSKLAETKANKATDALREELMKDINVLNLQLAEYKKKDARTALKKYHPDFEKYDDGGEHFEAFKEWYLEQPTGVQNLVKSENILEVAKALDMFKKDVGIRSRSKKEKDLEASQSVSIDTPPKPEGSSKRTWKRSEIRALSKNLEEYAKHQEDINVAMREGRIIND